MVNDSRSGTIIHSLQWFPWIFWLLITACSRLYKALINYKYKPLLSSKADNHGMCLPIIENQQTNKHKMADPIGLKNRLREKFIRRDFNWLRILFLNQEERRST